MSGDHYDYLLMDRSTASHSLTDWRSCLFPVSTARDHRKSSVHKSCPATSTDPSVKLHGVDIPDPLTQAAGTAQAIGTANAAHSSNGTNTLNNLSAIANQQAAAAAQEADEADKATKATAAEAAPGVDRQHLASIAAASSSTAAAAAAQTPGPNDPIPNANLGLRPEQLGALAGLSAKLAIDKEAKIQDQDDIMEL
ncbi:hypothetical protein B0H14DRAFT_2643781 [Mycena olivaceomarginata]|nr:hypothetical protein B0H14DRAFT_2643781 [Mycena olivaceomarginata]